MLFDNGRDIARQTPAEDAQASGGIIMESHMKNKFEKEMETLGPFEGHIGLRD